MDTVTGEIQGNALLLPWEVAERLGWKEGMVLEVEERDQEFFLVPSKETRRRIADLAFIYVLKHLGETYKIQTPAWQRGKWKVEVALLNGQETVGILMFTWDGLLIAEESDSPAKIRATGAREDEARS